MPYNVWQKHTPPVWCRRAEPLERRADGTSSRGRERAAGIVEIFEHEFRGRAELEAVCVAAKRRGLLAGVDDPESQRNVVRAALRPVAAPRGPW